MKLRRTIYTFKKPVLVLILAALLVMSVIDLAASSYLYHRSQIYDNQVQVLNNQHLANLIASAVNTVNRPLPIDAVSGKAYISDAKLSLPPAPKTIGQVLYSYTSAAQNIPSELHLASSDDIQKAKQPLIDVNSNMNTVFAAAPKLQSCARGITIDFASQTRMHLAYQKSLTDGRTAYFYTETACFNKDLLQYAEQLGSY